MKYVGRAFYIAVIFGALLPHKLSFSAEVQLKPDTYQLQYENRTIPFQIYSIKGIKVDQSCKKNLSQCLAYKVYQSNSQTQKLKNVIQGNFAGQYCEILGGHLAILRHSERKSDLEVCVFDDGTLISAWQLYGTHRNRVLK